MKKLTYVLLMSLTMVVGMESGVAEDTCGISLDNENKGYISKKINGKWINKYLNKKIISTEVKKHCKGIDKDKVDQVEECFCDNFNKILNKKVTSHGETPSVNGYAIIQETEKGELSNDQPSNNQPSIQQYGEQYIGAKITS